MSQRMNITWFDGFFLSMLATSVIVVSVNWERYDDCTYPLHIWIVVDYATVFLFRVFMFIDTGLAAGMGLDASDEDRLSRFKGRVTIISCLAFVLYPFLWAWTVVGSLWFTDAKTCLPEEGQKWGFLIWLIFSYCGLICVACISAGKWILKRHSQLQLVSAGSAAQFSEVEILFELIRAPDWAFLSMASGPENIVGLGAPDSISYHPGIYLSPAQREEVNRLIQDLPTYQLKGAETENTTCPICLDEFEVGIEVRVLPCAHSFHIMCIDEWLRLNVKCPHCRSCVFPQLDFLGDTGSSFQAHPAGLANGGEETVPDTHSVTASSEVASCQEVPQGKGFLDAGGSSGTNAEKSMEVGSSSAINAEQSMEVGSSSAVNAESTNAESPLDIGGSSGTSAESTNEESVVIDVNRSPPRTPQSD